EMLSGRRAFERETAADTMSAILHEDLPDLSVGRGDVPPSLDGVVRHCLERNPVERFQSARDLLFNLQTVSASSGPGSGSLPMPSARRRAPIGVREMMAWGLVGGLAIAGSLFLSVRA